MSSFDPRLLPEFGGGSKDEMGVAEWLSKLEWLCKLHKVSDLCPIIPLRLTGDAYKVYDQLPETVKLDVDQVKTHLIKAFEADRFSAYEQLNARRLLVGEPVDAYLADIKRFAELAGGFEEKAIGSAFMFGLPDHVKTAMRTNSRVCEMSVNELLECVRGILTETIVPGAGAFPAGPPGPVRSGEAYAKSRGLARPPVCFKCGQPGHIARGCMNAGVMSARQKKRTAANCCEQHAAATHNKRGAAECRHQPCEAGRTSTSCRGSGNDQREKMTASVFSPAR